MAGFGGFNEKKKKKPKQGGSNVNQPGFSSRPIFVPPPQIKKDKREN